MVRDTAARKEAVRELTFVYAGDIFDLLRTYYWSFEGVDAAGHPWEINAGGGRPLQPQS